MSARKRRSGWSRQRSTSRRAAATSPSSRWAASQFQAQPPYGPSSNAAAVLPPAYTADFLEVAELGCLGCAARLAEQTELALFWRENSSTGWNRIARVVATQRRPDAYTTSLESKCHYACLASGDGRGAGARGRQRYPPLRVRRRGCTGERAVTHLYRLPLLPRHCGGPDPGPAVGDYLAEHARRTPRCSRRRGQAAQHPLATRSAPVAPRLAAVGTPGMAVVNFRRESGAAGGVFLGRTPLDHPDVGSCGTS
jgi:hypothetical protein